MNFYKWFFLEEGRTPEGMFSFWHIFSVTITLAVFLGLAIFLAKRFKGNEKGKTWTLIGAGIAIVAVQLAKRIWLMIETDNPLDCYIGNLPLYLCDMQIFIIPIAALTKGRVRDICLDFIAIWGLLMGFMGTYFAGNIYPNHSIISFLAINSLLNHAISAFAAMFIFAAGMNKMEKRNIPFTVGILLAFMTAALIVDYASGPNYRNFMFFFDGGGTPFGLFLQLAGGIKWIYQIEIYILQVGYMMGFYGVYYAILKAYRKKHPVLATATSDSN